MRQVINLELCKILEFDHTVQRYMHKPESIQENEMHGIFWNFEIQTDYLIPTRRPELVIGDKKEKKKKKRKEKKELAVLQTWRS